MTHDALAGLFRTLCGIEMNDANVPHRLLGLAEHETRADVINAATLRRLQVVQQAGPSIPEPYVKWMSDRILTACNTMLAAADPLALPHSPPHHPAPPPVPGPHVPSPAWEPPVVRVVPPYRRQTTSAGEIVLGVGSLLVVVFGVGLGFFLFTSPRPSPKPARAASPTAAPPVPVQVGQGGGKTSAVPAPTFEPVPFPVPAPVPNPGPGTDEAGKQALADLKTAVAKIRAGLFDVGVDYASKAWKVPSCREPAAAVRLVSGYVKQYTRLSDEALGSLNGNDLEVDLGPQHGKCAFVERGNGSITFRVKGMNRRFTTQELANIPGARFRITCGYLDNAGNPANDLILGCYQYVHGLDAKGMPTPKGVHPIPDRWVRASKSVDAATIEHATQLLKLPPLELMQ